MMRISVMMGAALCLLGFQPALQADEKAEIAAVRDSLGEMKPDSVKPSPVDGLYEVVLGPHVFYVSGDGKYMLQGDLVDLARRVNLTQPARQAAQQAAIESIGEENMLVYSPEQKPVHSITVFTDIDCGYCRKLHQEMDDLNARGIEVRYLLYPRAGVKSHSYEKAVSVWCAEDRNAALTAAKAGKEPEAKQCDNPVQEHMAMGQMIGVQGTPTIILDDGRILPGYLPAARLAAMMDSAPGQ